MAEIKQERQPLSQGQVLPLDQTSWWARMQQRFPILQKKRGVTLVVVLMILPLFGLLGLLALRNRHGDSGDGAAAASSGQALITDDTYFYGQSEPVYPSREYTHNKIMVYHTLDGVSNITTSRDDGSWRLGRCIPKSSRLCWAAYDRGEGISLPTEPSTHG